MADTGGEQTISSYIQHHLTNATVGEGFWTFHIDTLAWSIVLGFVFILSFRSVAKKQQRAYRASGKPVSN